MKPQFKPEEIYLDLSKLSEEQRKYVGEVTNIDKIQKFFKTFPYLFFDNRFSIWNQCTHDSDLLNDKTEITYSQFLDMMGETIGEKPKDILFDTWVNLFVGDKQANSEKELINNDGTLYIGEGLENYYKEQLERTGKFKVASIDTTSEEVLQVDNNGWIKIESEKDLPKEDISCWWMDKKDGMILGKFLIENNNSDIDFILENATHYQPLIIPEPPKF